MDYGFDLSGGHTTTAQGPFLEVTSTRHDLLKESSASICVQDKRKRFYFNRNINVFMNYYKSLVLLSTNSRPVEIISRFTLQLKLTFLNIL